MSHTNAAVMPPPTAPQSTPEKERAPAQGHLYVRAGASPAEVHFLFEQQEKRLSGLMAASVVTHGIFVLLFLLIVTYKPDYGSNPMLLERPPNAPAPLAPPGP